MNGGVTVKSLFYDPCDGFIYHEDGMICDNIDHLISHEQYILYKQIGGKLYVESDEDDAVYNIVFPIPDDVIYFHYDKTQNRLMNDDGDMVFNIFEYVSPQFLTLFRDKKEDMLIKGKNGQMVKLKYY